MCLNPIFLCQTRLDPRLSLFLPSSLPAEWVSAIAFQAGASTQPLSRPNELVQCTQANGPRAVLLGSAAHAVSNASEQVCGGPLFTLQWLACSYILLSMSALPELTLKQWCLYADAQSGVSD